MSRKVKSNSTSVFVRNRGRSGPQGPSYGNKRYFKWSVGGLDLESHKRASRWWGWNYYNKKRRLAPRLLFGSPMYESLGRSGPEELPSQ